MDNDKTVELLTEIRDLQKKSYEAFAEWAKQSTRVIVPAYALLVILIVVELMRK